jgi:hypothetical protein
MATLLEQAQAVLNNLTDSKEEFVEVLSSKGVQVAQSETLWALIDKIKSVHGVGDDASLVHLINQQEMLSLIDGLCVDFESNVEQTDTIEIGDESNVQKVVTHFINHEESHIIVDVLRLLFDLNTDTFVENIETKDESIVQKLVTHNMYNEEFHAIVDTLRLLSDTIFDNFDILTVSDTQSTVERIRALACSIGEDHEISDSVSLVIEAA